MSTPQFHPAWAAGPGGERTIDARRPLGQAGLPTPLIYDNSEPALRLRELNFAAKRLADMHFVSGLPWEDALARLRWRGVPPTGPLDAMPDGAARRRVLEAEAQAGRIAFARDEAARTIRVACSGITGGAAAPIGWGGIVTATADIALPPIPRAPASGKAWPLGDDVAPPMPAPALANAVDRFMAGSKGVYGLLVAAPDRILFERYGEAGAPDRVTPSWSMNKSMTGTLIGRLLHLGWLENVYAPAPAPAWADPRGIHSLITLDDLLRMRSGLAMPCQSESGPALGFEGSAVYFDAADAFAAAQANIVAVRPGAVFRYINAGINVLGAILRARIEARGLPYPATLYSLLPDLLGMASYRMSGDIAGNLIASGAAFATLRDWAKLGVLYLRDGIWAGERLLPEGWADYALTVMHGGTSYAATFWTNADGRFPSLPPTAAWLSGASDQRVFILRGANRVVCVSNETDAAMDMTALDHVLAAVLAAA